MDSMLRASQTQAQKHAGHKKSHKPQTANHRCHLPKRAKSQKGRSEYHLTASACLMICKAVAVPNRSAGRGLASCATWQRVGRCSPLRLPKQPVCRSVSCYGWNHLLADSATPTPLVFMELSGWYLELALS